VFQCVSLVCVMLSCEKSRMVWLLVELWLYRAVQVLIVPCECSMRCLGVKVLLLEWVVGGRHREFDESFFSLFSVI